MLILSSSSVAGAGDAHLLWKTARWEEVLRDGLGVMGRPQVEDLKHWYAEPWKQMYTSKHKIFTSYIVLRQ